jgi:hypothetical protein
MKKVLFCVLLGSLALAQAMPAREDLVRIEILSPVQAKDLDRLGVVVNEVHGDYCIAEASPELLARVGTLGYKYTTLTENISRVYYENSLTKSPFGRYLTYQEFIDTMSVMAVNNPSICHLETLATTTTGKLLLAMKVSDNAATDEAEPAILWDANTHGDEKIGWAVAYEFLKYLLSNYGSNPEVTYLVDNREIWICPMFNPDGYNNSSRYNASGTDMNRNWGWMWGEEASPGSAVMGERETRGLGNKLFNMPVAIWVSYHAGTECIPYPWSYTDYDTIPENHAINWLSAGYSSRGNSYEYGQGSVVMYYINGSTKDLGYGTMGAMAWSIEVNYSKTPPASEIDPTFVRNRNAQLWFCRMAGHGIQGAITDSLTGLPLRAQVWLNPGNWPSFSERTNGDFHRFALPGTYSVTFAAPGYAPKTTSGVVVPNSGDSVVTVDVQLSPGQSNPLFGFQVIACSCVVISSNRTYPVRALGVHDGTAYTLDNGKWIILDLDRPIHNDSGNDFTVYRSSGSGTATVKAANDWAGPWTTVGIANSVQTSFDLGSAGLDSARYLYLKASGSFGFDAVEAVQYSGVTENRPAPVFEPDYRLRVTPSVVSGMARISCEPAPVSELRLAVYDIQGRQVQSLAFPTRNADCGMRIADFRGLRPGVYFLRSDHARDKSARFVVVE